MDSLGEKIFRLRSEAGISQDALAEKLNVSRQTVSRWETDNAIPSKNNIKSLCAILGADISYLSPPTKKCEIAADATYAALKKSLIFVAVAFSAFLICCIVACGIASYVSLMPSHVNLIDNAAAGRFRYIGIACVCVGTLALILLIVLIVFFIKIKKKTDKN